MDLRDKIVWITGASSGIGAALAVELAGRGARLVLSARRVDRLKAVRERCGPERARVLPLDLSQPSSFGGGVEAAEAFFGRIDVLVNNAGVSQRSLFIETDGAVIRRLVETNLLGPVLLTRAVLPGMVARGSGYIAFVSSLAARVGWPRRTLYAASKRALHGFADSLRAELRRHGVGVSVVAPGFVRTEVSLSALEGDGRAQGSMDRRQASGISAERCARAIVRALERERREVSIGWGLKGRLVLFLRIFAPGLLSRILRNRS